MHEGAPNAESLTLEDYLESHKRVNPDDIRDMLIKIADVVFDVIDTNHDGKIQWQEYQDFFRILMEEVDPDVAKNAFNAIDFNGDGVLSKEEFKAATVEYFVSKEDTPIKFMFGPLLV